MAIKRNGHSWDPLREGRQFWALALALQRESGLTIAAFCRREGLSDKAFWRWKRKLSLPLEPAASPAVFVPVSVTGSTAKDSSRPAPPSLPESGDRYDVPRCSASPSMGHSPAMVELHIHLANGRSVQAGVAAEVRLLLPVLQRVEALS